MRISLKPLCSLFKWLCCALLAMVLPIAMYAPTYYDFTNILSLYMPFVGIVLLSDLALLEKASNTEEIAFISNRNPIRIYLFRLFFTIGLILVFTLLANGAYSIRHYFSESASIDEALTIIDVLIVSCASTVFIGSVAMTFSTILNNIYIGYGISLIYWLFWNVNATLSSPFNPFSLIANPASYKEHALALYALFALLIMANCYFVTKSPFFISDKVRKHLGFQ